MTGRATGPNSSTDGDPETVKIRAWTRENSYGVPLRGCVHQPIKVVDYAAR